MLNLFNNAFKYNFPGGQVNFSASSNTTYLSFTISNTTHLSVTGLDERVFERFYRHLETVNSDISAQKGSGLGLSLCREIARAHGGNLYISTGKNKLVSLICNLELKSTS